MTPSTATQKSSEVPLAIVLEGVSEKWQMNVLQILGRLSSVKVSIAGHGTIEAAAFHLSRDQARHLATQITELLGPQHQDHVHLFVGSKQGPHFERL